jgi:hypothetical protein
MREGLSEIRHCWAIKYACAFKLANPMHLVTGFMRRFEQNTWLNMDFLINLDRMWWLCVWQLDRYNPIFYAYVVILPRFSMQSFINAPSQLPQVLGPLYGIPIAKRKCQGDRDPNWATSWPKRGDAVVRDDACKQRGFCILNGKVRDSAKMALICTVFFSCDALAV